MSIKVDIISGFLGAGKTTLIKQLFKAGFSGEKVVLIENEFGEIGIDGTFLKETGIDIKEINSGCICCSLVGDFSKSMEEVINKFNPDRIIIEPSGVGKLSDIIKAVENLQLGLVLNIVATVVDGSKCKIYMKNFGEFFNNQVEDAKSIIISKVENLEDEKIIEVYNLLKNKNPHANIILANLPHTDEKKLLEVFKSNPFASEKAFAGRKVSECDLNTVHRPVFKNYKIGNNRQNQQIKLPITNDRLPPGKKPFRTHFLLFVFLFFMKQWKCFFHNKFNLSCLKQSHQLLNLLSAAA